MCSMAKILCCDDHTHVHFLLFSVRDDVISYMIRSLILMTCLVKIITKSTEKLGVIQWSELEG